VNPKAGGGAVFFTHFAASQCLDGPNFFCLALQAEYSTNTSLQSRPAFDGLVAFSNCALRVQQPIDV
jgi:hypothetical protein